MFAAESPHPRRFALRARLLLPMTGPPLDGGVITIEQDRIVAVGENLTAEAPRDCGDVAIMPGLVNAHSHLELSCYDMPLGEPGMRFPAWINALVTLRRQQVAAADDLGRADRQRSVEKGLRESVQAGVTTVADVATWDAGELPAARPSMRHCLLRELIGMSADTVARNVTVAHEHLRQRDVPSGDRDYGLSPHAPYSTALDLVEQAVRLSRHHGSMVAMHLAESEEELELLNNGGGLFREVLEALGAWTDRTFSAGLRPLDYLQRLRAAPRALIIHGNYLSLAEWQVLAEERETMSVVYCPRTHHFFRHARYPLGRLLLSGVQVAIGTDSCASSPDVNLLEELRFAARLHADVAPRQLLYMGTLGAAKALGYDQSMGSLQCGKLADLAVVRLGAGNSFADDPYSALLDDGSHVCATYYRGRPVAVRE